MKLDESRHLWTHPMKPIRAILFTLTLVSLFSLHARGQEKRPDDKKPDPKKIDAPKKDDNRLPHTKLTPARIVPDLCVVKYRVSTASTGCQAHFRSEERRVGEEGR